MDGLGGSFHVYLYLSVALLWEESRSGREACWSGHAVGGSAVFHLFLFFFSNERHREVSFFLILCVINIAQGWLVVRVGGLSNTDFFQYT